MNEEGSEEVEEEGDHGEDEEGAKGFGEEERVDGEVEDVVSDEEVNGED